MWADDWKGQRMKKKDWILFAVLWLLASMLTLAGCNGSIRKNSVPCEALTVVYYNDIQPSQAESEVLLNNAVIEDLCRK